MLELQYGGYFVGRGGENEVEPGIFPFLVPGNAGPFDAFVLLKVVNAHTQLEGAAEAEFVYVADGGFGHGESGPPGSEPVLFSDGPVYCVGF